MNNPLPSAQSTIAVPAVPVLVAGASSAVWLSPDGEVARLTTAQAAERLAVDPAPIVCHAKALAGRLSCNSFFGHDVLELFAFVRPARFCVPTPGGLAAALSLESPANLEDEALVLVDAVRSLLAELAAQPVDPETGHIAHVMTRAGWAWGEAVEAALGNPPPPENPSAALAVWKRLNEWQEGPPPPAPGHLGVTAAEARTRLADLLGDNAEARPEQADYASAVTAAFEPAEDEDAVHVVLAEAGTGVGKTLGYIAPVSCWAEKNEGTVWLSTFTRNLQRQIDRELDKLYPAPALKAEKVVVRKGRENYLCLLNMEEAASRAALVPNERIALGLMSRWVAATRDGDMVGGDFPSWLADLMGFGRTRALTDRRGECIYSACEHYRRCFIEKNQRRARHADIVIANHALVMVHAARDAAMAQPGKSDERRAPTRYVFDEGHHVFGAADGAFAAHLSAQEARELRRWLLGPERSGRRAARARGLKSRIGDLIADQDGALEALDAVLQAARALPGDEWHQRIGGGTPQGAAEHFLALVRQQVLARAATAESRYGLETPCQPPIAGLAEAALAFARALEQIGVPLVRLGQQLERVLDDQAATLETASRTRIEAVLRGLRWRATERIGAWRAMLQTLMLAAANDDEQPDVAEDGFVDWFAVERFDGREVDVGMHRHYVDPTLPLVEAVIRRAHGVVLTSATLRDGTGDAEADWTAAEIRTGTRHLATPARRAAVPSPFDYAAQTRICVVTDVTKSNPERVAAAYRALFLAAGGGALGLFTAISRLRAVQANICGALEDAGVPLWAQHVDALDTTTLVEIFRAERNACLLGTDAVRDGVDVPGDSLRLIVFDRVPWTRPDILHKARKRVFGGARYDDMLTRLRLKQAYGRLIRRADDKGVFVLLDPALPSRLLGAFPEGATVERCGLKDAVATVEAFVGR